MNVVRIRDLKRKLVLVTDSQEVEFVASLLSADCQSENYSAYFVEAEHFSEVWGFYGIVPYLNCIVYPCELEMILS